MVPAAPGRAFRPRLPKSRTRYKFARQLRKPTTTSKLSCVHPFRVEQKHNPYGYRRFLPHIQDSVPLFVRFGTAARWILPAQARDIVFETCLYEHKRRFYLWAAVVMPEHVHLLFSLQYSPDRDPIPIYRILGDIKGVSAHRINKVLERTGRVWQKNRSTAPRGPMNLIITSTTSSIIR